MKKNKTIYFDMDGTIANLYGVNGWLDCLKSESTKPYEIAQPLIDLEETTLLLKQLKEQGYKIGVISWLAKNSTSYYDKAVTRVKKEWLKENLKITFDTIDIVPYGTPKHEVIKSKGLKIIFDDDVNVRSIWKGIAINPETTNINDYLTSLL